MSTEHKKQIQIALKKAKGTLLRVDQMVESDEQCPQIVQMISAAEGLLRGAKLKVLENHLQTCHKKMASANEDERTAFAKELVKILDISSRK